MRNRQPRADPRRLSSLSSQDASHKTGLDIGAVHINQERTHAVLAGREILKTVRITGTKCAEETNLRAAIINYASHHQAGAPSAPTRHRDTLEIHDVKWSHGSYSSHIATAAANGKVVLYDLNRTGVELAQLHEHHRQVHKLAFNPHQGYLLLSGSRDATARLWDLRDMKKDVMSCPSRDRYSGQSEGIRDIKWSPTDGVEFAFGTENGVIQRWDYRMNRAPKLKINAHDKTCYAIDWHPDGKHLASASADRSVRIWDFSSDQRRQKPAWVIRTPYPVFNAQWRPPFWSPGQDHGVWQCTQLVTAYDRDHPVVHVWDFRRPSLPFREISLYQTAPTDLLWRSRDLLWTVGREGIFTQSDVHFAPKVVDRRNMSSFAVSSNGDIGAFSQQRVRRRPSAGYDSDETYTTDGRTKRELSEKSSLPRSSADDSIDDSFLSSSYKRHHGRTSSNRSTKSISSTPPSSDNPGKMLYLNESLANQKHSFTPDQVALRGVVPGSINVPLFTFLAQKYNMIAIEDPPTIQSFQTIQKVFDANAEYAQKAGNHRLANSWRVVGQTVSDAVQQRATANHRRRLEQQPATPAKPLPSAVSKNVLTEKKEQDLLPIPVARAIYGADGQAQASADSSSQVPTPIARAINPPKASTHVEQDALPDPEQDEALTLPPSLVERSIHRGGQDRSEASSRRQARRSSIAHPSWALSTNDLEERRAMASSYRVPPRIPLSLEPYGSSPALNGRPEFDRHNSGESFAMFSASTDSHGLSVPGSFASGRSPSHAQDAESLQDRWDHQSSGPAFSSFGNGATSTSGPDPYMESPGGFRADVHKGPPPRINFDDSVPDHGNVSSSTSEQGRIVHEAVASSVANTNPTTNVISSSSEQSKAIHDIETLRKHNQLMRNSSSESDAFTSTHGSFSEASVSNFDIMEASGTIVPDGPADAPSPNLARPPSLLHESVSAPAAIETLDADSDALILADFLSKHASVDSELSAPFALVDMLGWLLDFHTNTLSDAQTVSIMLLLISDFLPHTHPLADASTSTLLNQYADHLHSLNMSPAQIRAILNSQLAPLTRTGINPLQAESILQTYHMQLLSLGLFNAAALLRRVAYPTYPAVYEQALQETQIGLRCTQCKSPINNPGDKTLCENCKGRQAPCPVCWSALPPTDIAPLVAPKKRSKSRSRTRSHQHNASVNSITIPRSNARHKAANGGRHSHTPSDASLQMSRTATTTTVTTANSGVGGPSLNTSAAARHHGAVTESPSLPPLPPVLYSSCATCGHTAHTSCLRAWHIDTNLSLGACPVSGCLCDCVRGPLRDEKLEEIKRRKAGEDRGRVRDDGRRVRDSGAAMRAAALATRGGVAGAGVVGERTAPGGDKGGAPLGGGGFSGVGGAAFGAATGVASSRAMGLVRAESTRSESQRGRGVDRDMGGRLETRDDSSAGITAGGGGRRVRLVEPSGRST
ncbi:hypothetical protein BFW01_g6359 [Lasiodiplodia theobromae]|nr:hypothetical protein BFW01_g6359 [Lasiodiplodia theobromae]